MIQLACITSTNALRRLPALLLALLTALSTAWPAAAADAIATDAIAAEAAGVDAVISSRAALHAPTALCEDRFVPYVLDHQTRTADGLIEMFEANGSGLAAGDLDGDGDIDLVLGAYEGQDTIFWNGGFSNNGAPQFRKQPFGEGHTRAVTSVDVDGDHRLDIVLTRSTGATNYFRNLGDEQFERRLLPGVSRPATALNWGDLDGDGDLDLVTASYDAGLLTDLGNSYLMSGGGGVHVYTQDQGRFTLSATLATVAHANALALYDLDQDGAIDIWVGNDFAEPDRAWLQRDGGWQATVPFSATAHSTMSFDLGDLDNDGQPELFATDMKPYAADPMTEAAWAPLMAAMAGEHPLEGDIQIMENVLQIATGSGGYTNQAQPWGVDATGWSWSAKFGDLDNDGRLDLYVVNGMIEARMFAHLPNHELVEANQVFRNRRDHFEPRPDWGLGSPYSGRGLALADFDQDGDLDLVVNNLRAPAQYFENRLCGGDSLQVDLRQPAQQNTQAIGARLALHTSAGAFYRDVRAASGYLSGDAGRVHFGLPAGATLNRLEITWPDGAQSVLLDLQPGQRVVIERE
ncbi:MAG: CRTAC1 family protein [Caldilineaceae bacterium]|nr:CRTAC1 family protein [Caldilineaceae bacterium]